MNVHPNSALKSRKYIAQYFMIVQSRSKLLLLNYTFQLRKMANFAGIFLVKPGKATPHLEVINSGKRRLNLKTIRPNYSKLPSLSTL